jgi:hypothetical protein
MDEDLRDTALTSLTLVRLALQEAETDPEELRKSLDALMDGKNVHEVWHILWSTARLAAIMAESWHTAVEQLIPPEDADQLVPAEEMLTRISNMVIMDVEPGRDTPAGA